MAQGDLGIDNISGATEIGRGGFSVVYAATNTLLGMQVAVKVLGQLSSDDDRRRFERECQVMGRLSHHPSVVTVHHAGYTDGGSPYLVMELVEGGSLADRQVHGPIPWTEAVDLITPIADALAYVHEADVLHRDVKPENILIGADGRPLLTDFGIARLGDATNTATGIAASWLHAPPETFENKREPRSDLYSLASTLHQLINGRPPFWRAGEDTLNPLMYRLINEPPPRLTPDKAPGPVADLLVRALAKSPEERPADLRVFAEELRAHRAAVGQAPAVSTTARTTVAFQPDARAAAAAAPQWFTPPANRSTDPSAHTVSTDAVLAKPAATRPRWPIVAAVAVAFALVAIGVVGAAVYVNGALGDDALSAGDGIGSTTGTTGSTTTGPGTTGSTIDIPGTTVNPLDVVSTRAGGSGTTLPTGRLKEVIDRGFVRCGVNAFLPGFGEELSDGSFAGFDVDFCRVIAAAVLGDAEAVEYVPLLAAERFTALAVGDIDVLSRNTSQTATRSGDEGVEFVFTTFHDGQTFMVGADSGITSIDDLAGASVCVIFGTTTARNVAEESEARNLDLNLIEFDTNDEVAPAYLAGQCDAWTSDATVLSSERRGFATPTDHVILNERLTSEPLSVAVAADDSQWATAVEWSVMLPVQAWEAGVDSSNIDSYSGNDTTAQLIAGEGEFDPGLGLQPGYPRLVITQVGNYEEIYLRNLADSGLVLAGSPNNLVANGGLLFVPPLR